MKRFALVPEDTIECQFGLYNGGIECYASGKYAMLDMRDEVVNEPQKFFCSAHVCSEHALAMLLLANERVGESSAKELGSTGP